MLINSGGLKSLQPEKTTMQYLGSLLVNGKSACWVQALLLWHSIRYKLWHKRPNCTLVEKCLMVRMQYLYRSKNLCFIQHSLYFNRVADPVGSGPFFWIRILVLYHNNRSLYCSGKLPL